MSTVTDEAAGRLPWEVEVEVDEGSDDGWQGEWEEQLLIRVPDAPTAAQLRRLLRETGGRVHSVTRRPSPEESTTVDLSLWFATASAPQGVREVTLQGRLTRLPCLVETHLPTGCGSGTQPETLEKCGEVSHLLAVGGTAREAETNGASGLTPPTQYITGSEHFRVQPPTADALRDAVRMLEAAVRGEPLVTYEITEKEVVETDDDSHDGDDGGGRVEATRGDGATAVEAGEEEEEEEETLEEGRVAPASASAPAISPPQGPHRLEQRRKVQEELERLSRELGERQTAASTLSNAILKRRAQAALAPLQAQKVRLEEELARLSLTEAI